MLSSTYQTLTSLNIHIDGTIFNFIDNIMVVNYTSAFHWDIVNICHEAATCPIATVNPTADIGGCTAAVFTNYWWIWNWCYMEWRTQKRPYWYGMLNATRERLNKSDQKYRKYFWTIQTKFLVFFIALEHSCLGGCWTNTFIKLYSVNIDWFCTFYRFQFVFNLS